MVKTQRCDGMRCGLNAQLCDATGAETIPGDRIRLSSGPGGLCWGGDAWWLWALELPSWPPAGEAALSCEKEPRPCPGPSP